MSEAPIRTTVSSPTPSPPQHTPAHGRAEERGRDAKRHVRPAQRRRRSDTSMHRNHGETPRIAPIYAHDWGGTPRDPHARPADPGVRELDPARARGRTRSSAVGHRATPARPRDVRTRRPPTPAPRPLALPTRPNPPLPRHLRPQL